MIKKRQLDYLELKNKYPEILAENKLLKRQNENLIFNNEILKSQNKELKMLLEAKIEKRNRNEK